MVFPSLFFLKKTGPFFLRGGNIFLKFLLIIYIGKYLTFEALGIYGLMTSSVLLFTAMCGFGFKYFTNREVVEATPYEAAKTSYCHFIFNLLNYLIVAPFLFLLWTYGVFETKYIYFFITIAIVEHLAEDFYGSLVNLKYTLAASVTAFIRQALWVLPVVISGIYAEQYRTIEMVFTGWIIGEIIALFTTMVIVGHWPWKRVWQEKLTLSYFKRGIVISVPFYISAIASVGAIVVDRYIIIYFAGVKALGVYTFLWGIVNVVRMLVRHGIIAQYSAGIMTSYKVPEDADRNLSAVTRHCFKVVMLATVLLCISIAVLFPFIAPYFQNFPLKENVHVLYLLLLGIGIKSLMDVLEVDLYAKRKDYPLLISNIIALTVAIIGNMVFIPFYGIGGAAMVLVMSSAMAMYYRMRKVKQW